MIRHGPRYEGFKETFKGEVMHSAQWNEQLVLVFSEARQQLMVADMTSRINGLRLLEVAPAPIQIVPNLQKIEGVKMTCFVRSRTWIARAPLVMVCESPSCSPSKH